jgi:hypothetical protein
MNDDDRYNMFYDADRRICSSGVNNPDSRFNYYRASIRKRNAIRMMDDPYLVCKVSVGAEKAADDFLNHPEIWIKGSLAQNDNMSSVGPTDELAIKWCALGRVRFHLKDVSGITCIINTISDELYGSNIEGINDDHHSSASKMSRILRRISTTLKAYC